MSGKLHPEQEILNILKNKTTPKNVIPVKTGIQKPLTSLDSRRSLSRTFYGAGVTNWELLEVPLLDCGIFL